jgi:hypothetical protein
MNTTSTLATGPTKGEAMMSTEDASKVRVGDRVAIAPHTDTFMQGYAYGTVLKLGRKYATVRVSRLAHERTVRLPFDCVTWIPSAPWLGAEVDTSFPGGAL